MSKPQPQPAELPQPAPTFGELIVVGEVSGSEARPTNSYIELYRRRAVHETEEYDTWKERAVAYITKAVNVLMERDQALIDLYLNGSNARELVALNFNPDRIIEVLEVSTPEAAKQVGFTPPMDPQTWRMLSQRCNLRYIDLDAVFGLNNVREYKEAGLSAGVLVSDLGVTVDQLLIDHRFNVTMLSHYTPAEWFSLGMRWRHVPQLQSPPQVIADNLGLNLNGLEDQFLADGEYVTTEARDGHAHLVTITNGECIMHMSGRDDHIHAVANHIIQDFDGHTHHKFVRVRRM